IRVVCLEALRHLNMPVEGCRIIIQGFGNVGSNAAHLLMEAGCKITGIAEYDGGLFNPNGIDIVALHEYRQRNSSVVGFRGAEGVDSASLLTTPCDILIPAAVENVITSRNATKVQAKIVCEGANGPTT